VCCSTYNLYAYEDGDSRTIDPWPGVGGFSRTWQGKNIFTGWEQRSIIESDNTALLSDKLYTGAMGGGAGGGFVIAMVSRALGTSPRITYKDLYPATHACPYDAIWIGVAGVYWAGDCSGDNNYAPNVTLPNYDPDHVYGYDPGLNLSVSVYAVSAEDETVTSSAQLNMLTEISTVPIELPYSFDQTADGLAPVTFCKFPGCLIGPLEAASMPGYYDGKYRIIIALDERQTHLTNKDWIRLPYAPSGTTRKERGCSGPINGYGCNTMSFYSGTGASQQDMGLNTTIKMGVSFAKYWLDKCTVPNSCPRPG
jgi:hypothetical protein